MLSSPSSKNDRRCFNPDCNVSISDTWQTGWRLRNLSFATLCNRCGVIYEEGSFCETFHLSASGWRCCETCGKQVHCGCIVSNHTFVTLDAGGIECTICARKNVSKTLSPIGQPPLPYPLMQSPIRNSRHTLGSTSPGSWQQSGTLSNKSSCPESRPGASSVGDLLTALHNSKEELYSAADVLTGFHSSVSSGLVAAFPQNQSNILAFGDEGLTHSGTKMLTFAKQGLSCSSPVIQAETRSRVSALHSQQFVAQGAVCNQLKTSSGVSVSLRHRQIGSDKFNDKRAAIDLFPFPLSPDGELQNITDDLNHGTTPLFYKTLTATDTRNGGQRLVIPKKCAETFFPRISLPEGIPLTVQDTKGKEWTFKFRFWHFKSKDRFYVLEGMANCLKSLQLQVGDAVSFGRRESDGKLIMGFRKASTNLQSEQAQMLPRSDNKPGFKAKKAKGICSPVPNIRQNGKLSSKRKLPKIDSANIFGRKVNLEDVQGLFRPPPNSFPHGELVEDFVFQEYEEAPVIGRPTAIVKDYLGADVKWAQCDDYSLKWAQCDDCLKWRKLPLKFLLPARWTCSDNVWDPDRSSCAAVQELTSEQSKALLSSCIPEAAHKRLCQKNVDGQETLEVADSLTSGTISKGNPASDQSTKKHPRHRSGCLCVVCNQPPSGVSLKHKSKDYVQSLQRPGPRVKQNNIPDKSCTDMLSCDEPPIQMHVNRSEDSDEDAGVYWWN